jgi:hypothetical protein
MPLLEAGSGTKLDVAMYHGEEELVLQYKDMLLTAPRIFNSISNQYLYFAPRSAGLRDVAT